ncbi:MAG: DUF3035 domain-containing protein [Gemmobacter sp.]|nr:DUF3035 domain-containing protein [Gemmobacter sp.]
MQAGKGVMIGALVAVLGLTACGERGTREEPRLMNLRSTHSGPDEFGILPPKPLEMPKDMAALPEPTPGAANLTDPTPLADAVVALGGRPGAGGGDGALVAAATRYGVGAGVRSELAAADLEIRRRNRPKLLERLFGTSVYNKAYEDTSVAQYDELERWRASGRRTPSAPPDPELYPDARR